ncbi:hypothetical protein RJ639_001788 [Escallonia herrerae]|uniref:Probable 6-phosphogluconolactonase n=1 Tax=Escallonia herrerae TaxID=1293975 RepID=A0AA88X9H4_9ASTE|nr:hypothetical protein RJ639_001788 [Escallonia herrerae]
MAAEMPTEKGLNFHSKKEILKFNQEEQVAVALAKYIADLSDKFVNEKGSFTVVLSGGTLIDTMRKLVEAPYKDSVAWSKWYIFFLDERVVPLDDPDSNYKLAKDGFLSKVPIPREHIYAINDSLTPEAAADDYEERLKQSVQQGILRKSHMTGFAEFDLMLLGMGPEGHVASLFCWHFQRFEKERWVTFIKESPKPPSERITFTFPLINSALFIAMVVTGEDAADAVKVALSRPHHNYMPLPVEMVSPQLMLTWFLDGPAAHKVRTEC